MAYEEYRDLYLKAQENKDAKYKMFYLDGLMHRKESNLNEYGNNLKRLLDSFVEEVLKEENKTKNVIIERDPPTVFLRSQRELENQHHRIWSADRFNPLSFLGDCIFFCYYNNSIEDKKLLDIFLNTLKKEDINYKFHFAIGKYETNEYRKGSKEFYKGYCISFLDEKAHKSSKKIINAEIKNISKKRKVVKR